MKKPSLHFPADFSRCASAMGLMAGVAVTCGIFAGCSSKNYVRSQTAPIVQNINNLDTKTAADHRSIGDTDARAQSGIGGALSAADAANQRALAAGTAAGQADQAARGAANRVDSLAGVVANLDQYKPLASLTVTFGFDKSALTPDDRQQLDSFAARLAGTRGYILQLTGGTDSVGDADYNYRLSQRRADAVVNYLAARYNVPPHKFYLVGIGKDVQIATDQTAAGRARNRRVEIQLLSNMSGSAPASAAASSQQP